MSDTNRPVLSLKKPRSLKFCILEEEGLYYPCSENKGADQLCSNNIFSCFRNNANIYNENGVFVERLADVKGVDHPPNPCIVGPNLYLITKDRLRLAHHDDKYIYDENGTVVESLADIISIQSTHLTHALSYQICT